MVNIAGKTSILQHLPQQYKGQVASIKQFVQLLYKHKISIQEHGKPSGHAVHSHEDVCDREYFALGAAKKLVAKT